MSDDRIKLEPGWKAALAPEFDRPYMQELRRFLIREKQARKTIYPPGDQIFAALNTTPLDVVRVVIIGQDPYHGPGQAHGLCFSVPPGVPPPPSLLNVFAEIRSDLDTGPGDDNGSLVGWARQGVLLLNAVLTVERGRANSHQGHGWETFTDAVVSVLNEQRDALVFLLWGRNAQKKGARVDRNRHLVLEAPHPSPLSASSGFFGCRHFSRANEYLRRMHRGEIDWARTA